MKFIDDYKGIIKEVQGYKFLIIGVMIGVIGNISATILFELMDSFFLTLPSHGRINVLICLLFITIIPVIYYIRLWKRESKMFEALLVKYFDKLKNINPKLLGIIPDLNQ